MATSDRQKKTLLIAAALLGLAGPARAQTRIDGMEHLFGASNTNAVAGHGGLTAGIGSEGDLSVLSWPSPSYFDQLAYISSNDLDARSEPHMGALDGMGSYLGLLIDTGTGPVLSWFRDSSWSHSQGYARDDVPVPVTTFTRDDIGLAATLTDVVSPDQDLLTRHVKLTRAAGSKVVAAWLVVYENLSPTVSRIPQLPVADWALDSRNDFVAAYDSSRGEILHFHPGDRGVVHSAIDAAADPTAVDYGPAEQLMKQAAPADADVDQLIAGWDQSYSPGVAAIVSAEPAPSDWQVGSDTTPICAQMDRIVDNIIALPQEFPGEPVPLDPGVAAALRCKDPLESIQSSHGWLWQPEDALEDLADATLSRSRLAAGETNGALVAPLTFSAGSAEGSALFAFGATLADARHAKDLATEKSPAEREQAAEDAAANALAGAALPDPSLGDKVRRVALRALVNVYVARDRQTGAIVASITRQPPYYLDWPRDGAFFNAALDVAGLTDWVTQRDEWYATLPRKQATQGSKLFTPLVPIDPDTGDPSFPADAWEMNYFADGEVGGPIRFEIDNSGLHLWSLALHAATLGGSAENEFLADVWPSTRRGCDLLARWTEKSTGLPAPANEDDHLELTSELQGATAVYSAMDAGARLAHAVGDEASARRYAARARELRTAIFRVYYDPKAQLFREFRDAPEPGTGHGTVGWAVWPARLFAPDDPAREHQLDLDMDAIVSILEGNSEGGSYAAKNIVAAALYGKDGGSRDKARHALDLLADVATPDTAQFGETYVVVSKNPLTWSDRVAPPHVWQGILFYLSAMALSDPAAFDRDRNELALPAEEPMLEPSGGCGCSLAAHPGSLSPFAWLFAFALARSLRRADPSSD